MRTSSWSLLLLPPCRRCCGCCGCIISRGLLSRAASDGSVLQHVRTHKGEVGSIPSSVNQHDSIRFEATDADSGSTYPADDSGETGATSPGGRRGDWGTAAAAGPVRSPAAPVASRSSMVSQRRPASQSEREGPCGCDGCDDLGVSVC